MTTNIYYIYTTKIYVRDYLYYLIEHIYIKGIIDYIAQINTPYQTR